MRYKDEQKQDAIITATIKLVNEIGFVSSSVSKIAKEAKVSPATIYIYYRNKDDLLVSTYVTIKKNLSTAILEDFNEALPVRDIVRKMWFNSFAFISKCPDHFQYAEQFSNSPYSSLVDREEIDKYFEPMVNVMQRGIKQNTIKDVPFAILTAFVFYPVMFLSNTRLCSSFNMTEANIGKAFTLAWDAIKA